MLVCLWDIEGRDKCESGVFGQVSKDVGRCACFGQFDSVDGIHDVRLEAAHSAGVRGKEQGLSLIISGRVTDYQCQVGNPVSLDRSIHLDDIRHRHRHDYARGL